MRAALARLERWVAYGSKNSITMLSDWARALSGSVPFAARLFLRLHGLVPERPLSSRVTSLRGKRVPSLRDCAAPSCCEPLSCGRSGKLPSPQSLSAWRPLVGAETGFRFVLPMRLRRFPMDRLSADVVEVPPLHLLDQLADTAEFFRIGTAKRGFPDLPSWRKCRKGGGVLKCRLVAKSLESAYDSFCYSGRIRDVFAPTARSGERLHAGSSPQRAR